MKSQPVTVRKLRELSLETAQELVRARGIAEEHANSSRQLAEQEPYEQKLKAQLASVEGWLRYCEAGAPALERALTKTQSALLAARHSLRGHAPEEVVELPPELAALALPDAVSAARASAHAAEAQERDTQALLVQSEHRGLTIAALKKDLHDTAHALIQRTGESQRCPVCLTEHNSDELLARLARLLGTDSAAPVEGLRNSVRRAREEAERARRVLASALALKMYSEAIEAPSTATWASVHEHLVEAHRRIASLAEEEQRIQSATNALFRFGVSWSDYHNTRAHVGDMGIVENLDDTASVRSVRSALQASITQSQEKCTQLRARMSDLAIRARTLGATPEREAGTEARPAEVVLAVERTQALIDAALALAADVERRINLDDDTSLEAVRRAVNDAILALDRAVHAERSEAQAQGALKAATSSLEALHKELAAISHKRENLARAIAVLASITQENSLAKATGETLAALRDRVSDIFARIHSPNEYVLDSFEGEVQLRKRDKETVRVSQISTGQRSAIALSIFLALNASAESAPPIVLIDDPIAHIDDLNALSFLDYLRDIVLDNKRQVFFATADTRLAALFERKFAFLGGTRFQRIALPR